MKLRWKRFFLMVIGAYLVLNAFNSGPFRPNSTEERVIMFLTSVALTVLGVWMIVRGVRLKPPDSPPAN